MLSPQMFPHFLEGHFGQPVVKDVRLNSFKLAMTIMTNVCYEYLALERKDHDPKDKGKQPKAKTYNVMHSTIELLHHFGGWTQQTASLARM